MRKALPAARRVRKITGLRKIRHDEIGLLYERTHDPYVLLAHAVVERAVISHDGIGKDFDPAGAVFLAKGGDKLALGFGGQKSRIYGIEAKAQGFPVTEGFFHKRGGVQHVEATVGKIIGYQCRRQDGNLKSKVRAYGQHGIDGHASVTGQIAYEQNSFSHDHAIRLKFY